MRDEFLVMGLGEDARRLADSAFLVEEFLAREQRAGRLALPLVPIPQKHALLHTHCHQKAFDAASATRDVLALVPGLAVEVVESSCCGMAGSFRVRCRPLRRVGADGGGLALPAVRAAAPDTLIVADGTSCRHQIADLTRSAPREAVHVVRVLERALADGH